MIKLFKRVMSKLLRSKFFFFVPDKIYISILFYLETGKKADFKNPVTFNQKLQWLKINNRNPYYTDMSDKIKAKEIVKNLIGDEYIIKNIGIFDSVNEINISKLPYKFVIKTNHSSGSSLVVDKNKDNFENILKHIKKDLKRNYFYVWREWPYKDIKPKILIEEYITDESSYELKDYKFFCFNGEPLYLYIASDRFSNSSKIHFDFFDIDFNRLNIKNKYENSKKDFIKPENYDKMVDICRVLSKNIPHVRIDLYNKNGQIYFGEFTFYHFSGMVNFEPDEWDYLLGDKIDISDMSVRKQ